MINSTNIGRSSATNNKTISHGADDELVSIKINRLKSAANNVAEKQNSLSRANRNSSIKKSFNENTLVVSNVNKGMGDG